MENILLTIAEKTRQRIREEEKKLPAGSLRKLTEEKIRRERESGKSLPDFLKALKAPGMSYICEVKKASPSKGII